MNWGHGVATKVALITAVAAGVVFSSAAAEASVFTLTGTNVDLTLDIDASNNITSASGTFFGDMVDLAGGQPGGPAFGPGNYFVYDNILLPNLDPALDDLGLLLGYVSGPSPFLSANISAIIGGGGTYGLYEYEPTETLATEDLTLTAIPTTVPAPPSWTVLLTGLIGLGFIAYRRPKRNSAAIAAI
jgi:hypothetical protein